MSPDQQIQLAEVFLVASSVLAVALADAKPEPLKTALSVAGLVIGIAWAICMLRPVEPPLDEIVAIVLEGLPVLAIIGWLTSVSIHATKWKGSKDQPPAG